MGDAGKSEDKGKRKEGEAPEKEKNLMQIKMMREAHNMNDSNERMRFFLSLLKEIGALNKKTHQTAMKNGAEKIPEKKPKMFIFVDLRVFS